MAADARPEDNAVVVAALDAGPALVAVAAPVRLGAAAREANVLVVPRYLPVGADATGERRLFARQSPTL